MFHNSKKCLVCLSPLGLEEFAATALHSKCYLRYFGLAELQEFTDFTRKSNSSKSITNSESLWNTSHFHGAFKKYSASLAGHSYIVKVHEDQFPELPDVEYVSNKIGRLLGIDVPQFYVVEFFGKRSFVSKNFIQKGTAPTNLTHIYHYIDPEKSNYSCETILKIITTQTTNLIEAEKFVEMCLFDTLIGNSDRHGRNIAFLTTGNGVRLAPIYDNPSALGVENGEFLKADWNPSGKVSTKLALNPSATDYILEFKRLGYNHSIDQFMKKIQMHRLKINEFIDISFCSDLMKEAFKKLIQRRFKELVHATK